ncbi:cupin domain-containing protein [Psychrobacillus sp. OK032]|uniref:cupin domain-containing protein n=1 Tax=Psychrobacillus sp. OK032 TaxID=1884358 RepID=UPI0008B0737A|nr:cupin domain-containing protein [Psychrobacillus sp. OK032]SER82662.1 Cupin domain protein [Psychrobacillus sp. OK032]
MLKSNILNESVIFPKGEEIESSNFIGVAWLQRLVNNESTFNCPISNVTFEPGARNNWHKHPGGQILLCIGGKGYYQEEDKPVQVIHEGDVVKILPDIKHWHGATPDSWFSHIAISTNPQKGAAEWLEPVTDQEYNNLK